MATRNQAERYIRRLEEDLEDLKSYLGISSDSAPMVDSDDDEEKENTQNNGQGRVRNPETDHRLKANQGHGNKKQEQESQA